MAKISKMSVGQTLYLIERQKLGNTSIRRGLLSYVRIIEISDDFSYVIARINARQARRYSQQSADKWRVKKPEPKTQLFGTDYY